MDLFEQAEGSLRNRLPYDGELYYFGRVLSETRSTLLFENLLNNIAWKHDQVLIHGKYIVTKRKVAWYGDQAFNYTYSNTTRQALKWTETLLQLKQLIEHESLHHFNSCLLNLYHDGSESMSWHSDGEKELVKGGAIASLSLGAERKFCFKHKNTLEKVEVFLEQGSLLLMCGETQKNWLHSLPAMKKVYQPRINLTFRQMLNQALAS